jgi:hypothetical protein
VVAVDCVGDAVGVADGVALLSVLSVGAGVGLGVGVSVSVGVEVADDCPDVPDGLEGVLLGDPDVAVDVGLEEPVGVEVDVGEDEGVDVGEDVTVTVSHCEVGGVAFAPPETTLDPTPGIAAMLCGAMVAVTANPAAVMSKTPPALRPIDAGRTRAKHM